MYYYRDLEATKEFQELSVTAGDVELARIPFTLEDVSHDFPDCEDNVFSADIDCPELDEFLSRDDLSLSNLEIADFCLYLCQTAEEVA